MLDFKMWLSIQSNFPSIEWQFKPLNKVLAPAPSSSKAAGSLPMVGARAFLSVSEPPLATCNASLSTGETFHFMYAAAGRAVVWSYVVTSS